jgi:hypothetical protein
MMDARRTLWADFTNSVELALRQNKPGSEALAYIMEVAASHPAGHAVFTGMLPPSVTASLAASEAWTCNASDREYAGLVKGLVPAAALATGMHSRRSELLADLRAGGKIDGAAYALGWHVYRGRQHSRNKQVKKPADTRPVARKAGSRQGGAERQAAATLPAHAFSMHRERLMEHMDEEAEEDRTDGGATIGASQDTTVSSVLTRRTYSGIKRVVRRQKKQGGVVKNQQLMTKFLTRAQHRDGPGLPSNGEEPPLTHKLEGTQQHRSSSRAEPRQRNKELIAGNTTTEPTHSTDRGKHDKNDNNECPSGSAEAYCWTSSSLGMQLNWRATRKVGNSADCWCCAHQKGCHTCTKTTRTGQHGILGQNLMRGTTMEFDNATGCCIHAVWCSNCGARCCAHVYVCDRCYGCYTLGGGVSCTGGILLRYSAPRLGVG